MLVPAYLAGVVAVAFVIACFGLAREGVKGAETAGMLGVSTLFALSSVAVFIGLLLMLAGPTLNDDGWWTQGQGQQFLAALCGWLALIAAGFSCGRRRWVVAGGLVVVAAVLFALWGLLLEGGVSGRGPLAFVR